MVAVANPALEKFAAQLGHELVLAQVLITRSERGYELRQAVDRGVPADQLRLLALEELRSLAQFTAAGAFRPLKSAPNLQTGWRVVTADDAELESALNQLYPGAIADWFATQTDMPPITHYREFTQRQTGMYRITTMLDDLQATLVIRACCDKRFCLKRRLWTVTGLSPDAPPDKSLIPCLEPCALLLEFARTATRIEQAEKVEISFQDAATLQAALEAALRHPDGIVREADFSAAANPRRLQLLLDKLGPLIKPPGSGKEPVQ